MKNKETSYSMEFEKDKDKQENTSSGGISLVELLLVLAITIAFIGMFIELSSNLFEKKDINKIMKDVRYVLNNHYANNNISIEDISNQMFSEKVDLSKIETSEPRLTIYDLSETSCVDISYFFNKHYAKEINLSINGQYIETKHVSELIDSCELKSSSTIQIDL